MQASALPGDDLLIPSTPAIQIKVKIVKIFDSAIGWI
jgi:hypothetical protein